MLEDYCRGTSPPYPGSMTMKLTAPGGDFNTEEKVCNLAPVTRRGTVNNPLTNLNTSHQGKTSDPSVTGKTPALEFKGQILVLSLSQEVFIVLDIALNLNSQDKFFFIVDDKHRCYIWDI